jgi:membrane associated rhomboid family serine protease
MALPFRDDLPVRRFPWVTFVLMVVNVAVFLFVQPAWFQNADDETGGTLAERARASERYDEAERFVFRWGTVPCELTTGEVLADRPDGCERPPTRNTDPDKSLVLALLTCMFLHANVLHLGGNMLFLWVFGNNAEDRLGALWYLGLYLVGGLLATLGFVAFNTDSSDPVIGASGAIAAVMGAYVVLHPRARVLTAVATAAFQVVYVPAVIVLGLFFVTEFFTADEYVAWQAHVAGMVAGFLGALALRRLPAVRHREQEDREAAAVRGGSAF